MQLGELIQHVQSMYSRGVHSDDSRLTSRFIYSKLVSARASLLQGSAREILDSTHGADQTIDCIGLIEAKDSDCYNCNETDDCDILMSKERIPRTFNGSLYRSVTSLDGSISYVFMSSKIKRYKKHRRYTANRPSYYIKDGFLFTDYMLGPRVISINGVFENPIEAYAFESDCNTDRCLDVYSMEFPIAATELEKLIEETVIEIVQEFSLSEFDKKNDGDDEVEKKALGNYGKSKYGNYGVY